MATNFFLTLYYHDFLSTKHSEVLLKNHFTIGLDSQAQQPLSMIHLLLHLEGIDVSSRINLVSLQYHSSITAVALVMLQYHSSITAVTAVSHQYHTSVSILTPATLQTSHPIIGA